jgi:ribosomal protein S18 acetylase RimI-like enzyme
MINTREFVITDYDAAVSLWTRLEGIEIAEGDKKDEISMYLLRNPGFSRVAEVDGVLVGVALCGHDGRRGYIYHLAVMPSYQGRGIGKLLVGECMARLRDAGLIRALILVAEDNPKAHAFYERSGWEDVSALVMGIDL